MLILQWLGLEERTDKLFACNVYDRVSSTASYQRMNEVNCSPCQLLRIRGFRSHDLDEDVQQSEHMDYEEAE